MKKLLSVLLTIAILLSMIPTVAFAEETLVFQADTTEISELSEGEEVAIPVKIATNPGFFAAKVFVTFDSDVFEFVNMVKGTELEGSYTINKTEYSCTYDREDTGDAETSMTTATPNVFFTITLKVKSGAAVGETNITVSAEATDYDFQPVTASERTSTITIAGAEVEEKTGYNNGNQNLTFDQVKADNYTLTAPGAGHYFAGWFKGLESAAGITKDSNGYYVLSAGTASGATFSITESRPKYDASCDETAVYNALWVHDDASAIRAFVLGVVGNTVTFYSTTGDNTNIAANATAMLKNALIAVNTTGYVKMLHDMDITGIDLYDTTSHPAVLDMNGNTLTTSGAIMVQKAGNRYESSYGKGQIVSTYNSEYAIELVNKSGFLSLRDLKITAAENNHCVRVGNAVKLESMERCELVATGTGSAVYLQGTGKTTTIASVGTIDNCILRSESSAIYSLYAVNTIDMISNTTITSASSDCVINNAGTINLGANNTVTGENAALLFNGGTVNFTTTNGTYRVASTGKVLDTDVTATYPAGYLAVDEGGKLTFAASYAVEYYNSDGTELLYTEPVAQGRAPQGYTPEYSVDHVTTYKHQGWAVSANGTELVDLTTIIGATKLYDVKEEVTLEANVSVTVGENTYQYTSLAEAIAAVGTDYQDAAGQTIIFKLFKDEMISKGFTMKQASYTVDLNGNSLTMTGTAVITDKGTANNRKIIVTSTAAEKGNMSFAVYGAMINSEYPADIEFSNVTLSCTGAMMGYCPVIQVMNQTAVSRGSIKYEFKNCVITDTVLVSAAVPVAYPAHITVENTAIDPGNCTNSEVVSYTDKMGYGDMSVSIDTLSTIAKNNASMFNGVTPTVPAGYTFADSDGDGVWKAERVPASVEGSTGTAEAPVVEATGDEVAVNNAMNMGDLDSLTVNHAAATLKFLADALDSIGSFGHANVTISVAEGTAKEGEAKRMSFNVKNGDANVPFNGSVEVTTSFTGVEGKKYAIFHDDNGVLKLVSTNVTVDSADPTKFNAAFTVKHFSDYVAAEYTDPYTAELNVSADTVVNGDNVVVNVNVSGAETTFSSAEIVVKYDPNAMEYVDGSGKCNVITGLTADDVAATFTNDAAAGTVTILDYGDAMATGEGIYSLTFKTKDGGNTNVSMTGGLSTQAQAESKDLSAVAETEKVVTVNHKVTVNEQDGGSVSPNGDGTYNLTINNYDGSKYTYDVTATVDGIPVDSSKIKDNGDGTFTIEGVNGDLVITHTATVKSFEITWNDAENAVTSEKNTTGTYDKNVEFTVKAGEAANGIVNGYKYTVKVTQTGTETEIAATPKLNDDGTTTYTIAAENIPGNLTITVEKETILSTQVEIQIDGDDVTVWVDETQITNGIVDRAANVTLKLNVDSDYTYSVTLDDGTEAVMDNTNTEYTISDIQTNVIVHVSKVFNTANASVVHYMTLDTTNMWLVKMTTAMVDGKVYTYDGKDMFYSEKYAAYCYLVIEALQENVDISATKFGVTSAAVTTVDYTMDVNMSGNLDINDAQLVWNMYTCKYNNFDTVGVEKFLRADVNETVGVDTTDAQTIVAALN